MEIKLFDVSVVTSLIWKEIQDFLWLLFVEKLFPESMSNVSKVNIKSPHFLKKNKFRI